jgi:hypothetical protein
LGPGWSGLDKKLVYSFIFEPKVEKINIGVASTHFVPLILILAPKIMVE